MAEKTTKSSKPGSETSRLSAEEDNGKVALSSSTGKKAVIETGGRQYLVSVGDSLEVNLLSPGRTVNFDALAVIDNGKTSVGKPLVEGVKVSADITEQVVKADKVTAIRYKAKKRVRKVRGHRQKLTQIKITKIA